MLLSIQVVGSPDHALDAWLLPPLDVVFSEHPAFPIDDLGHLHSFAPIMTIFLFFVVFFRSSTASSASPAI